MGALIAVIWVFVTNIGELSFWEDLVITSIILDTGIFGCPILTLA